jgi:hypothetical protein
MRPRGAGQTPYQYSRKTKALAAREMRRAIDSVDRVGVTDIPLEAAIMVADDANLERRPEAAIEALAQIPPFKVGRSTYRVIGERVLDAGEASERRQLALLCRTQTSTLHEHGGDCCCATCGNYPRAWYHDASRTWHIRNADGTFTQIDPVVTVARRTMYVGRPTDASEYSVYAFEIETSNGGRRRVSPPGIGRYDEAAVASLRAMRHWFHKLRVTHVVSNFGNAETDECCIADGTYTAKQYLDWWAQLEQGED